MIYYVIPAREGSKGLKHKNRKLFNYTISIIPKEYYSNVIVTTDDNEIKKMANGFKVIDRPEHLSNDTASIKDVLMHVSGEMKEDDLIVMLYLTYPKRVFEHVRSAIKYFYDNNAKSLLCKEEVKTHPYLCIYDDGSQIVTHNLYRRQDYPTCYEISHYIAIVKVSEIKNLNNNIYNNETVFYHIDRVIDVDTIQDFERLK